MSISGKKHTRKEYLKAYQTLHGQRNNHGSGPRNDISPETREEIKKRIDKFENPQKLALEYGVTVATIKLWCKR